MAEYIKFRLTAAKVGVSMAFLALIAGLAERAQSGPPTINARRTAAVDYFLKLDGIKGEAKTGFLKLEAKILKLDGALASLEHKLGKTFYDKQQTNALYLKQSKANTEFLKLDKAKTEYLKISDASKAFLKIRDTAADSHKLGGLTPDQFFQGRGGVFSGAATVSSNGSAELLPAVSPVGVKVDFSGQNPEVTLENRTSAALEFVASQAAFTNVDGSRGSVPAKGSTSLTFGSPAVQQETFQFFPSSGQNQVLTLVLSTEPDQSVVGAPIGQRWVAQLLIGLL